MLALTGDIHGVWGFYSLWTRPPIYYSWFIFMSQAPTYTTCLINIWHITSWFSPSCSLQNITLWERDLCRFFFFLDWGYDFFNPSESKVWESLSPNGIYWLQCHGPSVTKMCLVTATAFPKPSKGMTYPLGGLFKKKSLPVTGIATSRRNGSSCGWLPVSWLWPWGRPRRINSEAGFRAS